RQRAKCSASTKVRSAPSMRAETAYCCTSMTQSPGWRSVDMVELVTCAELHDARCNAAGVRMADGRVLIAGGVTARGPQGALVTTCETYDAALDRWDVVPGLTTPRQDIAITTLADGRVITLGGRGTDRIPLDEVVVWSPDDRGWSRIAPLPRPIWGAQAVVGDEPRPLLVGGFEAGGPTTAAFWIDRRTGSLSPAPTTRIAHAYHAVVLDRDGRVVVAGPWQERLEGERWRDIGGLFGGDADATGLAVLDDGSVLLAGGRAVEDAEAAVDDSAVL